MGFTKKFKELRALGGVWATPLKVEITQNYGWVWREKKTISPGEKKKETSLKGDSEEAGRWQKSIREDHNFTELLLSYELPKRGAYFVF